MTELPPYRPGPSFPIQTPEYLAARRPLGDAFDAARAPHFARFMSSEITHEQYRALIEPAARKYSAALEPIWVKHGGAPKK